MVPSALLASRRALRCRSTYRLLFGKNFLRPHVGCAPTHPSRGLNIAIGPKHNTLDIIRANHGLRGDSGRQRERPALAVIQKQQPTSRPVKRLNVDAVTRGDYPLKRLVGGWYRPRRAPSGS